MRKDCLRQKKQQMERPWGRNVLACLGNCMEQPVWLERRETGKTWEVRDIGGFRYEILWGAIVYQEDLAFSLNMMRPLQGF